MRLNNFLEPSAVNVTNSAMRFTPLVGGGSLHGR
jgi:hypothetical protein